MLLVYSFITKEANEGVFKGEQRYGSKEIKGLVDCGVIEFLTQTACHKSQLIGPHTTYFPSLSICMYIMKLHINPRYTKNKVAMYFIYCPPLYNQRNIIYAETT